MTKIIFKRRLIIFVFLLVYILCSNFIQHRDFKTSKNNENNATYKTYENYPLYLGIPSNSSKNIKNITDYLIERPQYSLSYNKNKLTPNWVAWHLDRNSIKQNISRQNDYKEDNKIPESWYKVKENDYQYSTYEFDKGHMCPSADKTNTIKNNSSTFYMSNMVPQSTENNQKTWRMVEEFIRNNEINNGKEAYIVSGPLGIGGESSKGFFEYIKIKDGIHKITVPHSTWKIALFLDEGTNDLKRINQNTKILAINVPNNTDCDNNNWQDYIISTDELEKLTNFDFFSNIPDKIENYIETKKYEIY